MRAFFILLLIFIIVHGPVDAGELLVFKNREGKEIRGELVELTKEAAVIKIKEKPFTVKFDTLDADTLTMLKGIIEKRMEAAKTAKAEELNRLPEHGWQETRWGMTPEMIREVFTDARPPKEKMNYGEAEGEKLAAVLVIPRYVLAEIPFEVRFISGEKSGLRRVVLMWISNEPVEFDYTKMRELLTRKYGDSYTEEDLKTGEGKTATWLPEGMTVRLSWGVLSTKDGSRLLSLQYAKPDANGDLKKL